MVTSLTFQLLLIINATTWIPSPLNAHSPRAMHHWLGLALLVSRLLIIISEFDDGESCKADPPQLHPPASQRKCPVVMSCTGRHWQGSCQAAVNKPNVVCFGWMRATVFQCINLQANRQCPAGRKNAHELQSMYSEVLSIARMYPAETKEMQYQINKRSMY